MKSIKSFLIVFALFVVLSIALSIINGLSLARLIDLGSCVGAASLLLGAWRQFSSNGALDQAGDMQRLQPAHSSPHHETATRRT